MSVLLRELVAFAYAPLGLLGPLVEGSPVRRARTGGAEASLVA